MARRSWRISFPVLSPSQGIGPTGGAGRLGYLDYDHPVFEIFRGPRSGDFTGARFFRPRDLQVAEPGGRCRSWPGTMTDRWPSPRRGSGRAGCWYGPRPWTPSGTIWPRQPVFLPFIHQLVRYASGRTETVSSFTAGQVLDVTDATAMATAGLGEVAEALAGLEERVALTPSGENAGVPHGGRPPFPPPGGAGHLRHPYARETRRFGPCRWP